MMTILKCKICGGDIELNDEKGIGTCLYCGSVMTFPKATDEQKVGMFNRGNHFRLAGEFDEALVIYEQIIQEDDKDAEAHWCAALSRFGIEYVEDPSTMEYLPTCHRASFDSFLDDIDVKTAIDNSDGLTKRQYQKDALKIEEVRQGILATSSKEDPFDVFICYKETDQNGGRTQDSVLAQDIYDRLTEKGYKVFFSRITLEDRVGTEYEPYIFAALNSAKAMIVVGTSKENLDSVWVKNEWSRFLAMMKKDRSKVILPCYKDMDPYDMPEALSVLQSYNMASIGFIQDLIRGISKIASKVTNEVSSSAGNQMGDWAALVKRGYISLEDQEWDEAKGFFEKALNIYPESGEAYVGLLLAGVRISDISLLNTYTDDLEGLSEYKKAIRFASKEQRNALEKAAAEIINRKKDAENEERYQTAQLKFDKAKTIKDYEEAARIFKQVNDYKDAETAIDKCKYHIEKCKIKQKKRRIAVAFFFVFLVAFIIGLGLLDKYNQEKPLRMAMEYAKNGEYETALKELEQLSGSMDTTDYTNEVYKQCFEKGVQLFEDEDYDNAKKFFFVGSIGTTDLKDEVEPYVCYYVLRDRLDSINTGTGCYAINDIMDSLNGFMDDNDFGKVSAFYTQYPILLQIGKLEGEWKNEKCTLCLDVGKKTIEKNANIFISQGQLVINPYYNLDDEFVIDEVANDGSFFICNGGEKFYKINQTN